MRACTTFLISLSICTCLFGQNRDSIPYMGPGAPLIQYFSPLSYQAAPRNFMIVQAPSGLIYVGNQDGVLEYDGAVWELIPLPNKSPVTAVAVDHLGSIFVGGESEMGYLETDSNGLTQYHSLISELPEEYRNFSFVERIISTSHGTYFQTPHYIFYLNGSNMHVWTTESEYISGSGAANDLFFLYDFSHGLRQSQGDSSVVILSGGILDERLMLDLIALPDSDSSSYLMMLNIGDLLHFDGRNEPEPFPVDPLINQYLQEKQATQMLLLSDGRLAFSTIHGGVLIMNQQGQVEQIIDKQSGLPGDETIWIYEDQQDGLWIALANGLARVELHSPITFYGAAQQLEGGAIQMIQHGQQLYVGNSVGLFRLFNDESPMQTPFFAHVPEVPGGFAEMIQMDEDIIIGTIESVGLILEDGTYDHVTKYPITQLHYYQKQNDYLWLVSPSGLTLMTYDSLEENWSYSGEVDDFMVRASSIIEDTKGNLWANYGYNTIARIDIPDIAVMVDTAYPDMVYKIDHFTPEIQNYRQEEGIPIGANQVYYVQNLILSATSAGLKRFDPALDRFVVDSSFGPISTDTTYSVSILAESSNGILWISYEKDGEYGLGRLERGKNEAFSWEPNVLRRLMNPIAPTSLYPDPDQDEVLWIGTGEGIYRYDERQALSEPVHLSTLIHKLKTKGQNRLLEKDLFLPYSDNDLQFQFALPNMIDPTQTEYQFWLKGFDPDWSSWSQTATKEYTNLPEGDYTFLVRAKDSNGLIHKTDTYAFTIRPPWYRTWWAYLSFGLIALLVLVVAVTRYNQWRLRQLRTRNEELEQTVTARTEEIQVKNKKLEHTLDTLKTTQDQLIMQEKMASLGQMTAGIAHEIKNPLNFINNFSIVAEELAGEFREDLDSYLVSKDPEDLELLMELVEGLKENTSYIREHGERATEIVRGMMNHSRGTEGERVPADINLLLEEAVQFAYQSFQALQPSFELNVDKDLSEDLTAITINKQDIQRVIINLVGNACGTMFQKTQSAGEEYKPQLSIQTQQQDQQLRIRIRDNGMGIPTKIKDQIFQPFFTTKSTGQGHVGLGLSISYDIITQGYQGSLTCESKPGEFAEFWITLPTS